MKRNIIYASLLLVSLAFTHTACDDNKDEYLSDFSTIVYLLKSGEQPLTLYKTGEDAVISLTIDKAGSNLSTVSSASIEILSAAQLAIYNSENYTSYKMLPSNCYQMPSEVNVQFGSKEAYKNLDITFKTDALYTFGDLTDYVLPISVSSPDSVNAKKNIVLYKPTVLIPTIYFEKTGYTRNEFADGGTTKMDFKSTLLLPIANKWAFNCDVVVDETLLNEYNQENGLSYALLPQSAYTISGEGKVNFTSTDMDKSIDISVSNADLKYGNYVLPLRLTACSKPEFLIDLERDACLYGISYVPSTDKLQSVALTVNMLSSNAVEPSEGLLANLLDGNTTTYFHSAWSVAVDGDHYLQINLDKEYSAFSFKYTGRSSGGGGNPASIILMGSNDNVTFKKIDQITAGLPASVALGAYESPIFVAQPFKHLRIVVPTNRGGGKFFVLSEFSMKGI